MEEKNWNERATHRACRLFMSTDRMHRKAFERLVTSLGIHRSQHFLLMRIAHDGVGSQKELAERLGISTAAVAVTLKKLENGGYIERSAAEGDSRNNQVQITEAGRRMVGISEEYIAMLDDTMFRGIDEQTLAVFTSCLETMKRNLDEFLETGREEETAK